MKLLLLLFYSFLVNVITHTQTTVARAPKLTTSKETKAARDEVETANEKRIREAAEEKAVFNKNNKGKGLKI
jgi:hypothetical protein